LGATRKRYFPASHKVAFIYFEDDPGKRLTSILLTHDEAHRIAVNIAKLSDLLRKL
jgi:hypothetical protein